jgi:hypothetical protein
MPSSLGAKKGGEKSLELIGGHLAPPHPKDGLAGDLRPGEKDYAIEIAWP